MKFVPIFIFVMLSMFTTLVFAGDREIKKHFFILGGGGENPATSQNATTFDKSYEGIVNYLNANPNVTRDVRFDGQYKSLMSINSRLKNTHTEKATAKAIKESINKIKNDIENGKLVEGDQLIIYIDSHGALQDKSSKEITHTIGIMPDYDAEESSESALSDTELIDGGFSIDRLIPLIEAAKKKGIRLGIIDVSCYSGSMLKLADKNTCVITGASENLPSKATFAWEIAKNLKTGRSMEEVFLRTREMLQPRAANPQISGPVGEKTKEFLIGLESFFIDDMIAEKLNKNINTNCNYTTYSMPPIDKLLNDLKKVVAFNLEEVGKMEKALTEYNKHLEVTKKAFDLQLLEGKKTLQAGSVTYQWSDLKDLDIEDQIEHYQETIDEISKKQKTANNVKLIDSLNKKNAELRAFLPIKKKVIESLDYQEYLFHIEEYGGQVRWMWRLTEDVGASEKKLYLDIYKSLPKEEKNICSEIIF